VATVNASVPRFLRFRWIFGGMLGLGAIASVVFDFWRWWPQATWLARAEVVGSLLAFAAFESGMLALVVKWTVQLKADVEWARKHLPPRKKWWTIWTGGRP
jgi:hypothetical protein